MPHGLWLGRSPRRRHRGFAVAPRRGEPPAASRDLYQAAQDAGGVVSPALLQVEPRTGARRGRFDPSGADEEVVGHRVLIAAELERLLEPGQLAGLDVTWLPTEQPTPSGDYVALAPLLSRWVGGSDPKRLPKLKLRAHLALGPAHVGGVA